MVGDDETGDDGLAEAPACFDQALIGARDRVLGEHHAGDIGIKERLHDHADAWAAKEAHALAVGDGRIRVRRPPDLADGTGYVGRGMDIE